jgi:hypothetical protein
MATKEPTTSTTKDYSCDFQRLRALIRAADDAFQSVTYEGIPDQARVLIEDIFFLVDTARRMADDVLVADEGAA